MSNNYFDLYPPFSAPNDYLAPVRFLARQAGQVCPQCHSPNVKPYGACTRKACVRS